MPLAYILCSTLLVCYLPYKLHSRFIASAIYCTINLFFGHSLLTTMTIYIGDLLCFHWSQMRSRIHLKFSNAECRCFCSCTLFHAAWGVHTQYSYNTGSKWPMEPSLILVCTCLSQYLHSFHIYHQGTNGELFCVETGEGHNSISSNGCIYMQEYDRQGKTKLT